MSDNSEILIRALEASGSQREADLARAILGAPAQPAAPAPAAPAAAPAVPVEAEERSGPTLADLDKMTVNEIARLDPKVVDAALVEGAGS